MAQFLDLGGLTTLVNNIKTLVNSAKTELQGNIDEKVDKTTTVNGHALSGNVTVSKSDVGLGNVTNEAQIPLSQKGVASGVATLGTDGKLTSSQLPALKTVNGTSIVGSGNISIDLTLFKVVSALPEDDIDATKIYLVESTEEGENNTYTEYMYVNSAWEKIGEYKSDVDLTPYVKFTDIASTSKAGAMSTAMVTKLNGIEEGANKTVVDSSLSADSTNPVQNKVVKAALDGKAASGHTHQNLTIKLNSGTTEGTNQFTYNGGTAKSVNITASSIGAATSGHNHNANYVASVTVSGNNLVVNKNGSNTNLTIPFATNSTNATNATNADHADSADTATTASKVANAFTIKVNSPSTATEGTNTYTFNGSAAKTLDIKAGSNVTLTPAAGSLTIAAKDTTYSVFKGATSSAAGSTGLVPAPATGKQSQFLRGDGTWASPANTTYSAGTGLSLSGTTFNLDQASSTERGGILLGYEENGRNYPVELDAEENRAFVNVPWQNTTYNNATTSTAGLMSAADKAKLDGIASGANKYTLPAATDAALGGIMIGAEVTGKNYAVQLDDENKAFVNVPWTDNNTTYSAGTGLSLSGTTFAVKTGFTTSGKNYKVTTDSSGNLYVNVPWTDNNTTYGIATASTAGLVKPISVITKPTINSATTTAGKYYHVQMSSDGNMFVNVPWTDTKDTAISDEDINALFT